MVSTLPVWDVPLSNPPHVRQIAIGTHGGRVSVQRWRGLGFWSLHCYQYSAKLLVNGVAMNIEPGSVSLLPPGADLEYHYSRPSTHTYAHFDLADNGPRVRLAAIRPFRGLETFDADFRPAVGWFAQEPARTTARVWELLWRLVTHTDAAHGRSTPGHATVDRAVEWIELHLGEPIAIASLADAVDVSHVHLVRLFRSFLGMTPLDYVHARRAARAEYLLKNTALPTKAIASQVGLADPQQLNKLCRRVLGRAPTAIRSGGQTRIG